MPTHPSLYGTTSYCHNAPSLIVLILQGGFVTQNRMQCGQQRSLPIEALPEIACTSCGQQMVPTLKERNYRYACPDGHSSFFLGDQVPHWSDRFDYHRFGLVSDHEDCYYRTYGRSTN